MCFLDEGGAVATTNQDHSESSASSALGFASYSSELMENIQEVFEELS